MPHYAMSQEIQTRDLTTAETEQIQQLFASRPGKVSLFKGSMLNHNYADVVGLLYNAYFFLKQQHSTQQSDQITALQEQNQQLQSEIALKQQHGTQQINQITVLKQENQQLQTAVAKLQNEVVQKQRELNDQKKIWFSQINTHSKYHVHMRKMLMNALVAIAQTVIKNCFGTQYHYTLQHEIKLERTLKDYDWTRFKQDQLKRMAPFTYLIEYIGQYSSIDLWKPFWTIPKKQQPFLNAWHGVSAAKHAVQSIIDNAMRNVSNQKTPETTVLEDNSLTAEEKMKLMMELQDAKIRAKKQLRDLQQWLNTQDELLRNYQHDRDPTMELSPFVVQI